MEPFNRWNLLTYSISIILASIIIFIGFQVLAEEWTAEQKEVWTTVEKRWALIIDGNAETLAENLHHERIIILRESKTTGTIQVKITGEMTSKEIRKVFHPYKIKKICDDFPYPEKKTGHFKFHFFR